MAVQTLAETVQQLLSACPSGVLSTSSVQAPGFPFGSWTPFAIDSQGRILLLLSGLAVHTQNLRMSPQASVCVVADGDANNPPRATVLGDVAPVPPDELDEARQIYLERHPRAAGWMGFGDFMLFRLEPQRTYVVAGFGQMGWVETVAPLS